MATGRKVPLTKREELPIVWPRRPFPWNVIISSKQAAQIFLAKAPANIHRQCDIYTFSRAVVDQLADLNAYRYAASTMNEMLELFWQDSAVDRTREHYFFGAEVPAVDLVAEFQKQSLRLEAVALYTTVAIKSLAPELLTFLNASVLVCFAAPSAIRAWKGFIEEGLLQGEYSYLCIGPTTAAACRDLLEVEPAQAEEATMLSLATCAAAIIGSKEG